MTGIGKRTLRDGSIRWYARILLHGRQVKRGSFPSQKQAQDLYWKLKGQNVERRYFPERHQQAVAHSVTIKQLCDLVVADYRRNGRVVADAQSFAAFWIALAGATRATTVTGATLLHWADRWLADGLSPGRTNRRMAFLLRGYHLAMQSDPPLLQSAPRWDKLVEPPPRAGFLEFDTFTAIRGRLPVRCHVAVTILFWTGMRSSEATGLLRSQATFNHARQLVRLDLGGTQTKNREGRAVVFGGDLYFTLAHNESVLYNTAPDCPWICHHQGKRLGTFDTAWKSACVALGLGRGTWMKGRGYWKDYDGPKIHDLRRTGVRNLDRAGVGRDTARKITGHKTDSVFTRYNIVSDEDLFEAGQKVAHYIEQQSGSPQLALTVPRGTGGAS